MSSNAAVILRNLGALLHVPGAMALASLPVCVALGEGAAAWAFGWTALSALLLGQALFWTFRRAQGPQLHHGMVVAALGWLVIPLLGALPFLLIAHQLAGAGAATPTVLAFRHPLNALFESFSGFTGTGLTMALRPGELPASLQWWRSFTEWVGGVGVIVLMLSVLRPTVGAYQLYYSEGREEKILPSVASTVRAIWWIYLLFTLSSVLALRLAGLPWWAALNYGMTSIATGGFGVTDHSLGDYGLAVRLLLIPIMLAGAVSFRAHYRWLRQGRGRALWGDLQHRALWAVAAGGTALLALENLWSGGAGAFFSSWQGAVDSAFQWASALSTAGLQSVDLARWSPTAKLLLSLAMILGGAAGSTAGGIKMVRAGVLYQGLRWRFRRIGQKPHQVLSHRLNGEPLSEQEAHRLVESAGVLAALWAGALWAGVLVMVHLVPEGYTLSDVILEVASAQGNVGLSTGITGPALAWGGKLTLIASMWIGRLEIIPVLILLAWLLGRGRPRPASSQEKR